MPEKSRLMPISYYNPKQEIRLSAYADTIVLEPDGREQHLRAIRFGGYPEMVRAMSDAIYAGATLETEFAGEPAMLACEPKKYECHLSHDGIYAEATILSLDEEDSAQEQEQDGQTAAELPPRKCILFCPAGDRQALFEALDRKTSVPLIPEFQDYVLDELRRRRWLKPLRVISIRERLEAWLLLCKKDEANIVKVLEDGLKTGIIHIPGTLQNPHGFDDVHSVTSYLSVFGVTVAERIRNQFQPLFDPTAEQLSPEILRINDYICAHAGYSLYAQYRQGDKSIYAVISKEKARDGYMRRPAVLLDARKGAFRCPNCGGIIELPSSDDTDGWTAAKPEAFRMENRRNHQCMSCAGPLWTAVNPSVPSPWVKIPEYGWVHRKLAVHAMQKTKNPAALDALQTLRENPDGYFPTRGACRRYPLSSYIKKRYRGRLDGLIVDELHEYNNDSGQGDAMAELFGTAKKVIGMTATLINGYSSGIFHLLYRTSAQLMLADEGYRTEILTDKIKTTDREEWVQKKLAAGMQVLIVNPSLVETGLDLNAFTTLVFYSMGYKLFTLRQASRRSWRINQKAPAVKVYMLYYEDTMQQKCLKLMASKLAVAGLIEGNFSEEGLAAMSDVQDMTSQMAKELMLGIRDNVEDIAAAFRKMAFENPDREVPEVPAEETSLPPESVPAMIEQPKRVFTVEQEEKLQAAMVQLEQQKAKRAKKTQQVENQLSLFDSVA